MTANLDDLESPLDRALLSPGFISDPYPTYSALREQDPVHWSSAWDCWVIAGHADVSAILLQEGRGSSVVGRVERALRALQPEDRAGTQVIEEHFRTGISHTDPPEHTRIRAALTKAFSPREIGAMRPRVEALVRELLDGVEECGEWDLIADFAYPLPALVIAEVMGLAPDDRADFKTWSDDITAFFGSNRMDSAIALRGRNGVTKAREYIRDLAEQRRREPRNDLISRLMEAERQGEGLSEAELLSTAVTFMVGGHETTTALISSGLWALFRHPAQLERLRSNPELLPSAVEEFMRFESPNQRLTRIATRDMEIGDRRIHSGDLLMLLVGSANRDPAQFPDPDAVDVGRRPNRHLGFALGAHFCIGANLARMEAQVAIGEVLRRFPTIRPAVEDPRWERNPTFRMLESLPVAQG
jgi:cytochrome P450